MPLDIAKRSCLLLLGLFGCVRGGFGSADTADAADGGAEQIDVGRRIIKTTREDFEASGSVRSNLDTTTVAGQMSLGSPPAPSMRPGPRTTGPIGDGGHALALPDGRFLIVHGRDSRTTSIYDPLSGEMTAGPETAGQGAEAAVGSGALSLQRSDGRFLILHSGGSVATSIYDPAANSMQPGPRAPYCIDTDPAALERPDGTFLVLCGCSEDRTVFYLPEDNAFTEGPRTREYQDRGTSAIARPDRSYLILFGYSSATSIYDPTVDELSPGPDLTAQISAGAQSIERPDGTFLIIHGEHQQTTTLYDPAQNTVASGPLFPDDADIWNGALALQRCDGTFVIFAGRTRTLSYIYDPVANTIEAGGPEATGQIEIGSAALQSPHDGSYLVIHGHYGDSGTSLYDAGCPLQGSYQSEPLRPEGSFEGFAAFGWNQSAAPSLRFEVRTAPSEAGLDDESYRVIGSSGDAIGARGDDAWLQVRITYSRAVPGVPGAFGNVYRGRGMVTAFRRFSRPTVFSYWASYD